MTTGNQFSMYGRDCHDGPVHVFDIGKAKIFAGSRSEVRDYYHWALVISFDGTAPATASTLFKTNPLAAEMLPPELYTATPVPTLSVDWPDRGVPPLQHEWWALLMSTLAEIDGPVAIHCQGGHGRTGTALAILAALPGGPLDKGKKDPVKWLRGRYCPEAVEATAQLEYVERITGRKVTARPSDFVSRYSGGSAATNPPRTASASGTQSGTADVKDCTVLVVDDNGVVTREEDFSDPLTHQWPWADEDELAEEIIINAAGDVIYAGKAGGSFSEDDGSETD